MLEEVGRTAAPIPALPVMAMAGPFARRVGAPDQLDGVAAGERIVTVALHERSATRRRRRRPPPAARSPA